MRVNWVVSAWLVVLATSAGLHAADPPRLVEALKNGNREIARALLKARGDVNTPEVDGTTALHWAVRADDVEMVRLLLRAGARVKVANRYGVTPLSVAATNGHATIIEMLLGAGADPNSALPEGETVLMTAARTGNAAAVRALLAHGAEVNPPEGWFGETALMWAAAEDHAEVARVLLANGAQLDARSKPLEFPKFTFNGSTMVSTPMPRGGLTPLMFAARQGAMEPARALTEAGANLNLSDRDGTSALVMAIINGHYDLAALLLEKGADPNIADASGMAALYAAVDMRTAGPLINRPSRKPTGDLDSLDLVRMLLDRGANPNARLKTPILQRFHNGGDTLLNDGATPLMRAAKSVDVAVMRLLVAKGANPNLMTKAYVTPVMFAAGLGGGRSRGSEQEAIDAITVCLEAGADIDAFNNNGQTALHIAVERSDAIVNFLAERGAELDLKDRDGRTPLDVALGVSSSAFQGPRGAAPSQVRQSTAALLRRWMSRRAAK